MLPAWPPPFAAVQAAFVTAVALLGTALIGWMVRRERRLRGLASWRGPSLAAASRVP